MQTRVDNRMVCYGNGGRADNSGPDNGRNIVFVHGAGFDHGVWVMPARYFARHGYNVVAPDLPGHGGSAGPPLTAIEAMADWLAQLVGDTCSGPVNVVGHSMGSLVALAFAGRHGALTRRIALLGTSVPMTVGPPLLQAAADHHHAAVDMANTWSHAFAPGLGATANPGMSNFYSGQRWIERLDAEVYHADLDACNRFQPDPAAVSRPALIITGGKDKMTPAGAGRALARSLADARVVQLHSSGHSMWAEQPNEVLDALINFFADGADE